MMKSRDDQRGVNRAKNRRKHNLKGFGDSGKYECGNSRSNLPAEGDKYKMSRHDRQQQAANWNHDHGDHLGRHLSKEILQINQGKFR